MPDDASTYSAVPFGERLSHAWNAFKDPYKKNQDEIVSTPDPIGYNYGSISYSFPDRRRYSTRGTDKTIAIAIYNRIATDVASASLQHIRTDDIGGFKEEIDSGLNNILTLEANIDQTNRAFIQDLTMSMLEEGVVAAVPVDTTINPNVSGSYDILTMRVGKVVGWYPEHICVELYNDKTGHRQQVTLPKKIVGIIENPFYTVMNEPNSTLQRLIHKLALLDAVDEQSSSGKMDLIIQLPYITKSKTRQDQAEERRKKLEQQLEGSKYGIGYIDGTERVIQLNRPLENNLMSQIEYLTSMLYSQLGMTAEILNGTASEDAMLNYYRRTVDVILNAIVDEFKRKFLTKTARSQGQTIRYFRDPFSLTPTTAIADIADKFTRNEILSPNEVRGIVGFKPSQDAKADELRNRNINQSGAELQETSNRLDNQNEGDLNEVRF